MVGEERKAWGAQEKISNPFAKHAKIWANEFLIMEIETEAIKHI